MTLAAAWAMFEGSYLADAVNPERSAMRFAFYAGGSSLFGMLLETDADALERRAAVVHGLLSELDDFCDQVEGGTV